MDVRRLFAGNMAEALALVRAELGDDALILESRSVTGGVELIAAAERRSLRALPERRSVIELPADLADPASIARHLEAAGLSVAGALELARGIEPATAGAVLADRLPVASLPAPPDRGRFAFIGPSGAGKTTTIAKLIARRALSRGGDGAALVTLDTMRPAAVEQLRSVARILSVPVLIARDAPELRRMLKALGGRELVLIDTPGASLAQPESMQHWLDAFGTDCSVALTTSFASSSSYQQRVFEALAPHADIVVGTHFDDAPTIGELIDCAIAWKRPLGFIANGPDIPDDLLRADRRTLAERLLKLPDRGNPRGSRGPVDHDGGIAFERGGRPIVEVA